MSGRVLAPPLRFEGWPNRPSTDVFDENGYIFTINHDRGEAADLVTAVNSHATLVSRVEALEKALTRITTGVRRYLNDPGNSRDYESMRAIIDVCADIADAALKEQQT